jgi:glyoxylase I family protein
VAEEVAMSTATQASPSTETIPSLTGVQHLGLTVSDIDASEAWYSEVLGLVRAFVEPHAAGPGHAVVMTRPGTGLFVGLEHHPDADRAPFSSLRTGLDHLALQVGSREDIDQWVSRLDALGIEHGEVFENEEPLPVALVLVHDPDGIPVELFWLGG